MIVKPLHKGDDACRYGASITTYGSIETEILYRALWYYSKTAPNEFEKNIAKDLFESFADADKAYIELLKKENLPHLIGITNRLNIPENITQ